MEKFNRFNEQHNRQGEDELSAISTGDYLQLIGGIAAAIGDTLQAVGQGIAIQEAQEEQLEQQKQQQQMEQELEQLKQQVAQLQQQLETVMGTIHSQK